MDVGAPDGALNGDYDLERLPDYRITVTVQWNRNPIRDGACKSLTSAACVDSDPMVVERNGLSTGQQMFAGGDVAIASDVLPQVQQEKFMHRKTLIVIAALALVAAPQIALADGDGAVTGVVGGAVAGALVGGPVGAVVGGVAGGVIGNGVSGPGQQVTPCGTRTTQTTNSDGSGSTTQTTNCQN